MIVRYGTVTLYDIPSQAFLLIIYFITTLWLLTRQSTILSSTPLYTTASTLTCIWFGLVPVRSSLLRESLTIFFPHGTEIFHFPCLQLMHSAIQSRLSHSEISDSSRLLTPDQSFSQPITSFICFCTLGILPWLIKNLFAFKSILFYWSCEWTSYISFCDDIAILIQI